MRKRLILFLQLVLSLTLITKLIVAESTQGRLNINIGGENQCALSFDRGWNLFSFCLNIEENASVLSPIRSDYRYIMRWDNEKQEFEIYSPRSSQPPPDLNDNESYFIYLYDKKNLIIDGEEPEKEFRKLEKGWNAPSYQSKFMIWITQLIEILKNDLRYVMKWNSTKQEFEIYSPKSSNNPFSTISNGEGFFIYTQNRSIIIYP